MNIMMLVAAVAAINPVFQGAWCSTSGEPVALFTQDAFVDTRIGFACHYDKHAIQPPGTFQAEQLDCSELSDLKTFSPLDVSVKFTKNSKGLVEWYVDRDGDATVKQQLLRCEEPND